MTTTLSTDVLRQRQEARSSMQWLLDKATTQDAIDFLSEINQNLNDFNSAKLLGYRDVLWERQTAALPEVQFDFTSVCSYVQPHGFDIQSVIAIMLAAMNIKVAHYSPDTNFLSAIGLSFDRISECSAQLLEQHNLTFIAEQTYYPALAKLNEVRAAVPNSVLELLIPLLHPAAPKYHLIGTTDPAQGRCLAQALLNLGLHGAAVSDKTAAISVTGQTRVLHVNQNMQYKVLQPEELGIERVDSIITGSAAVNAALFKQLLSGYRVGIQPLVVANTAFALNQIEAIDPATAVVAADEAIGNGSVKRFYKSYCQAVNS